MDTEAPRRRSRSGGWLTALKGAVALFVLGMVGVLALALTVAPSLRSTPGLESLSYPLLVVVAAVNSTLLLLVFTALGTYAAPRARLRSRVYDWATGRPPHWDELQRSLPLALVVGAVSFAAAALLDALFAPFVTIGQGAVLGDAETLRALAASVPLRLFYGGITEEILLRWGVMAPVALVAWRVRDRLVEETYRPTDATMWVAIVVAAVLFGLGHLPALATSVGLTPLLVVRTVLINAVVGVALGWLFWRRSLEAAMIAHASFHVTLLVLSVALVVLT